MKVSGLGSNLIQFEGSSENRVVAGKSAVSTVIHALVRKIERGKKAHRFSKLTLGES